MKRLEPLDGLRGLAVLLVLASHGSVAGLNVIPGFQAEGLGRPGVFLFFVLSSFLLTNQLLERVDQGRTIEWGPFAKRRLLRILPAYALALSVHVIAGVMEAVPALEHFGMIRAELHFWTIPVEMLFYLSLPLIMIALGPAKSVALRVLMLVAAGAVVRWFFPPDFTSSPPRYRPNVLPFLPIFLVGSILAVLAPVVRTLSADRVRLLRRAGWVAVGVLVLLAKPVWSTVTGQTISHTRFHLWFDPYALLWAVVLLAALQPGAGLRSLVSWPPLRWLGQISYSVYLFHALILGYFVHDAAALGIPRIWLGPAFLMASCAAGAVSYWLIERPFLRSGTARQSA